jgi:hypothetical protein
MISALQMSRAVHSSNDEAFLLYITETPEALNSLISETGKVEDPEWNRKLDKMLEAFQDVLQPLPPGLPPKRAVDHKIELTDESNPPSRPSYRMSPLEL